MGTDQAADPPAKRGGHKRTVDVREIINGLVYVLGTGFQWAALPKDLPSRNTVNRCFKRWEHDRTLDRLHDALYVQCREQAGRQASPTVGIIDSQSVTSAEKGGRTRPASVPARKSRGRNAISSSDVQDRDGGVMLMASIFGLYPSLLKLYADGSYQGPRFQNGVDAVCKNLNVEIVKRSDAGIFVVLPKRWIAGSSPGTERTIAWLNLCRQLAKNWERLSSTLAVRRCGRARR